jgi:hypothetical protein
VTRELDAIAGSSTGCAEGVREGQSDAHR